MVSKNTEPDADTVAAWARLIRAAGTLVAGVEKELKRAGLPPLVWYDVLHEVAEAGNEGLRPFEIEQRMLLQQYGVSRLLARMQKDGLLERIECPDDGRGHSVAITPKGLETRRRIWAVYGPAIEHRIGAPLSSWDRRRLIELLGKIGSSVRAGS